MRELPLIAGCAVLLCGIAGACQPERKSYVPNAVDGNTTPTMSTYDVSTFISDSGYTRYHITAPSWLMFEDSEDPFWRFPEGLELVHFDLAMTPDGNVLCDSAVYFSRRKLWRLDGNVLMVNTENDSFQTQQVFWDQADHKMYSDSFIHIVRSDRVIEGYGFESSENMLEYTVNTPTAILPADRRPGAARDTSRKTSPAPSAAPPAAPAKPAPVVDAGRARAATPSGMSIHRISTTENKAN